MRSAWATVLLLIAATSTGCIGGGDEPVEPTASTPEVPYDEEGFVDLGFEGVLHERAAIESAVGGTIHAEIHRPADAGPERPVPVIATVTPYNAPGIHIEEARQLFGGQLGTVERFVERGYAVAYVDARGFGGSSGCWDYYGDDELADAVASVDWLAAQPWSNGKVGMMGLSYPGTTQLLTALGGADGLATIVPLAPEPSVYENQFKNGVPYRSLEAMTSASIYAALYPALQLAPPGTAASGYPAYAEGRATSGPCLVESTAALNDPDTRYGDYFAERDRQDDAHLVDVPVLWSHGFWDQNVKPDTAFPFWTGIDTPKRALFWHGYHQFPSESATGRDGFDDAVHRWYDHWLHGADNGAMDQPTIEVQDSLGRWRHEDSWPPLDANATRYYVGAGSLDTAVADDGTATITTDPRTNFGAILAGGSRVTHPVHVPEGAHHTAATEPLGAPVHIAGIAEYQARLALDHPRGQLVVGLFDVAPDGTWTLVDRGALDLRHRNGLDVVDDVVPGEVMDVRFDGWPTDWVFDEGHRIATVWVGTEMRYQPYWTGHTITLHEGEGTYVELPVIGERTEFFDQTSASALDHRERMEAPEGFTVGP